MKRVFSSYNLGHHTTFRVGGQAKYSIVCDSTEELRDSIEWCRDEGVPWFVLGAGSNVLVSEDGFPGLVIKLGGLFKAVRFRQDTVEVGAGVLLPTMCRHFMENQWGGFEFMCDIPGTVGAGVRINAGTKEGGIKDHFISTVTLTSAGEVRLISKKEMQFSYRHTCLSAARDIVLSARFALAHMEERDTIRDRMRRIVIARRQSQPKNRRNCGSIFKNPPGQKSAGWYIDRAGLKGMRIGDAMVAHENGNWIVNIGHARAFEVRSLIDRIQDQVAKRFAVQLEREVIYVPEDVM